MRLVAISSCALVLAGSGMSAALAQPAPKPGPLPASITSELPRTARPQHYTIEITPNAAALTFSGRETIDLTLFSKSRSITLNAHKLAISRAVAVPASGGAAIPLAVTLDNAREQARFTAASDLAPGAYRLQIDYTGVIGRQPSGLFALDYPDKRTAKTTRGLFTQFETGDAREFAPMFDEPSYKATFDVSAIVPEGQLALGNMPALRSEPLPGKLKRVTFATSPRMSSYLLFFAVGDYERMAKRSASGTEVGIVSPAGSGATATYALDALAQLLPYYNDYFGTPFPLPKLDNVAAPGQSQQFGAMENWGAIMTFEQSLLLDPRNTSPSRLHSLYTTQAHETAHQWFGNLVTPAWWDDLWLNEGFASWFETKATNHFQPGWYELVASVNSRERAMELDSLSSSHAIVVPIRAASEADNAFDTISYSKGEAVITMLEAYAGEDKWRTGVQRYMAAHAYGSAVTADLWRAQEQAGTPNIARIADSFTRQPGVPLITATQQCVNGRTRLSLSQGEYSRDRRVAVTKKPRHWLVPLTARASDGSLHPLLLDRRAQLTVPGCGPVIVNGGQTGYFRTLYDTATLNRLAAAVPTLPPIEQLGLVRNSLSLSAAGYQDYGPALALLQAIPADANPIVASGAIGIWSQLYGQLDDASAKAKLAAMAHARWYPRLQQLGFEPRKGELFPDSDLRSDLLTSFGTMGDPTVLAEARRRFNRLASDRTALDGPLKSAWLQIVSRNASPADWDLLRKLGRTSTSNVEKTLYYSLLGRPDDDALSQRALDLAITDEPGATTSAVIISGVAAHDADLAFNFATSHQAEVLARLDDYSREAFLPGLLGTSSNPAMIARLEALRATRPDTAQKPYVEQLARLRERLVSRPRIRQQISAWLARQ